MKKLIVLLMTLLIALSLVACNSKTAGDTSDSSSAVSDSGSSIQDNSTGDSEEFKLTILHTNDLHGVLQNVPKYSTIVKQVREGRKAAMCFYLTEAIYTDAACTKASAALLRLKFSIQ